VAAHNPRPTTVWAVPVAALCKDAAHHVGFFDAGEADVEAAEGVGEAVVIDAEDVQHRGVQVAEVDRIFGAVTLGNLARIMARTSPAIHRVW
jgi:hypothetical protein